MNSHRGVFGAPRPPGLPVLPPAPMPSHRGLRPLKAWRWVGCFSPELMVCAANVRVGPGRQSFYAVWDRTGSRLHEHTGPRVAVTLAPGRAHVRDRDVQLDLTFAETAGIETVSPSGRSYAWTRKQAVPGAGRVMIDGEPHVLTGTVIVDDSSGYHARHTAWRWCAGAGLGSDGRHLAWNLVEGVHDAPQNSERTLWVDGVPRELPPTPIATDLTAAGDLTFTEEASRTRDENRIVVRSHYRQPFGTFAGSIGGIALAAGFGVMEEHDVHW